jgi:glycerol-3-phosphate cytidylyltransferase
MGEIVSGKDIQKIAAELHLSQKKVVFTNGCFDLLHIGHTTYLSEAAKLGDVLIVGLNSDKSVRKIKSRLRPIIPEKERAQVLASLSFVDYVIVFDDEKPDALINAIKPVFHVKGGDYSSVDLPEKNLVESYGGKVIILPETKNHSTKKIISKIVRRYGQKGTGKS